MIEVIQYYLQELYYTIAVETYFESSVYRWVSKVLFNFKYTPARAFLTEKVFKSYNTAMFIPFGMKGTMKALEELGYENFHEEFDCDDTYDIHDDNSEIQYIYRYYTKF